MDQHHHSSSSSPIVSDAALATLYVNKNRLVGGGNDALLVLIILTASPLQLNLSPMEDVADDDDNALSLIIHNGSQTLKQRNAILRWISGLGFHNALDRSSTRFLGGYNDSAKASPAAAVAIAEISSWMSVADSIRRCTSPSCSAQQINDYLSSRAYLIASSRPTLADYDVCFALLQLWTKMSSHANGDTIKSITSPHIHLQRWMHQVVASAMDLIRRQNKHLQFLTNKNKVLTEASIFFMSQMQHYHSEMKFSKSVPHSQIFIFPKDVQRVDDHILHSSIITKGNDTSSTSLHTSPPEKNPRSTQQFKDKKMSSSTKAEINLPMRDSNTDSASNVPPTNRSANTNTDASKTTISVVQDRTKDETTKESEFTISALDIRVGQIIKAWPHESAEKLYCEEINLGEDKPRLIASGLRPFYSLEEMQNQRVLVLCNLKSRNLV